VGVQYLTEGWWWDIFENLEYYGDPDIRVFIPTEPYSWAEPEPLKYEKSAVVNGHSPFGATNHPNAVGDMDGVEIGFYTSIVLILAVIVFVGFRRWKKAKAGSVDEETKTTH